MLSRALILATVTLLVGCLTAVAVRAENLDAGKSPSQIFSGTCSACHKSQRGLLKSVPASSLPGFLRQHYTTGTDMASVLAAYLISNGAADPRYQPKDQQKSDQGRPKDARPDQLDRFGRRQNPGPPPQEASRPDSDAVPPQGEGARPGRDAKRFARPAPAQDANRPADGQAPLQAATDSKAGTKQKQGKRGKPAAEEPPKPEEAAKGDAAGEAAREPARTEPGKAEPDKAEGVQTDASKTDASKTDAAKTEAEKPEGTKPASEASRPSGDGKSEPAKTDAPRQSVGSEPAPLRSDLAPPVTPSPPPPAPTAGSMPEPAASPSSAAAPPAAPTPPEVAATAPAPTPPNPPGPPVPPISR